MQTNSKGDSHEGLPQEEQETADETDQERLTGEEVSPLVQGLVVGTFKNNTMRSQV